MACLCLEMPLAAGESPVQPMRSSVKVFFGYVCGIQLSRFHGIFSMKIKNDPEKLSTVSK